MITAGDRLPGEQLCRKGPGDLGRHEPAVCPGSNGGQEHGGWNEQDRRTC